MRERQTQTDTETHRQRHRVRSMKALNHTFHESLLSNLKQNIKSQKTKPRRNSQQRGNRQIAKKKQKKPLQSQKGFLIKRKNEKKRPIKSFPFRFTTLEFIPGLFTIYPNACIQRNANENQQQTKNSLNSTRWRRSTNKCHPSV